MHIVEIYRHDELPYEVLVNRENLIDLAIMLQNCEHCLQFRVHTVFGSPFPVERSEFSAKNFPKWVTEFDYDL